MNKNNKDDYNSENQCPCPHCSDDCNELKNEVKELITKYTTPKEINIYPKWLINDDLKGDGDNDNIYELELCYENRYLACIIYSNTNLDNIYNFKIERITSRNKTPKFYINSKITIKSINLVLKEFEKIKNWKKVFPIKFNFVNIPVYMNGYDEKEKVRKIKKLEKLKIRKISKYQIKKILEIKNIKQKHTSYCIDLELALKRLFLKDNTIKTKNKFLLKRLKFIDKSVYKYYKEKHTIRSIDKRK